MRASQPLLHFLLLFLIFPAALAGPPREGLPDPARTPGAVNETISQTEYLSLCRQRGWTRAYRPAAAFTNALKRQQLRARGEGHADLRDYEEDHLIPLCLAGAPEDPRNLWPQPRGGTWTARDKDDLEATLCRQVCQGKVPLPEAQQAIATDWIAAHERYVRRRKSQDDRDASR